MAAVCLGTAKQKLPLLPTIAQSAGREDNVQRLELPLVNSDPPDRARVGLDCCTQGMACQCPVSCFHDSRTAAPAAAIVGSEWGVQRDCSASTSRLAQCLYFVPSIEDR